MKYKTAIASASLCVGMQLACDPALAKSMNETAALEAQVSALMDRINTLEAKERAVGSLTEKEAVTTSNNLDVKIKGHVNRAVLWHSNGKNSNVVHVDNSASSSRLNVTATGKLTGNTKVGAVLEMALQSNASTSVDVHNANDSNTTFQRRKADLFLKNKMLGDLYIGHGATASDGTMEDPDFSSTTVVSASCVADMAGGTKFYDTASAGTSATVAGQSVNVNSVFDNGDGFSRKDRIRYNTPKFWGLSLQTSHHYANHNDNWDIALKFSKKIGDLKLAAQGAYMRNGSNKATLDATGTTAPSKYSQVNGSVGVLYKGFSVFFAALNRNHKITNLRDASVYFGKLGYQRKFLEAGNTAFSVDYGQFNNMLHNANPANVKDKYKGTTIGVALVQVLDRIGTDVYLGFRNYKLKAEKTQAPRFKDVKSVMGGMRVRF